MSEDWPLNLWGFARLIAPRRCCAYLAWYDAERARPRLSEAADRRIRLETLREAPNADEWNWSLYAEPTYQRRANRLRSNARHLIDTVLPYRVRRELRSGDYIVSGVGPEGRRIEIDQDDLAGLTPDFGADRLTAPSIIFERVSVRPRDMMRPQGAERSPSANSETAHSRFAVIVIPDGMIGIKGAVEEIVRALFGDQFVAEITVDELEAAATGNAPRAEARRTAVDRLLPALQSGELTAFAVQAARGRRIPLPPSYWNEWIAEWRPFLSGRVDVPPGTDCDVPRELREIAGWPCAIDEVPFRAWLHGVRSAQVTSEPQADLLSRYPPTGKPALTPEPEPTSAPWLRLHNAVSETARTAGRPIAWARQAIQTAIQRGLLTIRGVAVGNEDHSADRPEPSVIAASCLGEVRAAGGTTAGGVIEWNKGESPPELVMPQGLSPVRYSGLQVLRDRFEAWLLLMKGKRLKLPPRFVGMDEAFVRLRRHIKKTEHRSVPNTEIAQIIVEHARRERLQVWWTDKTFRAAPLFSDAWYADRLPAGLQPEQLILNGAIKANTLVFIRREFAQWLGDRPAEANPSPKPLSDLSAAPIPDIAREWSREPGAETEEKIAGHLWRAFFEGRFLLQSEEDAHAPLDRQYFAEFIELNKPDPKQAPLLSVARVPSDPEFHFRALAAWAAEGFPGMDHFIRLASVEKYLLPRTALAEWCRPAGQQLPRFWQSGTNSKPRSAATGLPKKRPPAARDLRTWYKQRVRDFKKMGKQPSREDDYRDANREFQGNVIHDMIAQLRRELAPEWTEKGRPSTKSEKKKSEM